MLTRWTIDGRGDTGTRAIHYTGSGKKVVYNVSRLASNGFCFWLSEAEYPDGSRMHIDATEMTEAGAHSRCEFHAANHAFA